MLQYIQKDEYESVVLDDEWIILNTDNFTVTKLNEVGGLCWSLLHTPQTLQSISQVVKEQYNLDCKPIESDIESFLAEMVHCGLVKHAN